MIIYKAKWILPSGNRVLTDSCLVVQDGKILDVIGESQLCQYKDKKIIDYGNSVITPGFINLHTHLQFTDLGCHCEEEISFDEAIYPDYAKLDRLLRRFTPRNDKSDFVDWIIELIKKYSGLTPEEKLTSFKNGLKEGLLSGTTCICQLSKEDEFFEILNSSPIKSFIFLETFSNSEESSINEFEDLKEKIETFQQEKSENVEIGISPHSIYNVHPVLWKKIADHASENDILVQTHLAESKAEMDWLKFGSSDIDKLHSLIGWSKVNPCEVGLNPVKFLDKLGVFDKLRENLILTHLNQVDNTEIIDLIQKYNVNIAFCPRSNIVLHNKTLDINNLTDFYEKIGLGTDSKFSNMDLSILHEASFIKKLKNSTGLGILKILDMLTINAAKILKIDHKTGSLEKSKDADFLVFKLSERETYQSFIDKDSPDEVFIKGKQVVKSKMLTGGIIE